MGNRQGRRRRQKRHKQNSWRASWEGAHKTLHDERIEASRTIRGLENNLRRIEDALRPLEGASVVACTRTKREDITHNGRVDVHEFRCRQFGWSKWRRVFEETHPEIRVRREVSTDLLRYQGTDDVMRSIAREVGDVLGAALVGLASVEGLPKPAIPFERFPR